MSVICALHGDRENFVPGKAVAEMIKTILRAIDHEITWKGVLLF